MRATLWAVAGVLTSLAGAVVLMSANPDPAKTANTSAATLFEGPPGFRDDLPLDSNLPSLTDDPNWGSGDSTLAPISIGDAESVKVDLYAEVSYRNTEGQLVIDLLEQDYAYLTVIVTDQDGRPVVGAEPTFATSGSSELLTPEEVSSRSKSDASGTLDFAVIGGDLGLDRVNVTIGDTQSELLINVISLRASGFPVPPEVQGGIPWTDLMKARIRYRDDVAVVEFPDEIQQRAGKLVKLSGFMMPLDPDLSQRRFLLTSNPPSCFFHIPGGPSGAVEVFAPKGIEATWDPVVIEGRFELLDTDEFGVIYRLQDAKLLKP